MGTPCRMLIVVGTFLLSAPSILLGQVPEHMCSIDLNKPAYYATETYQNFQRFLVPALRRVEKRHSTAYIDYEVPFQDIWDLAGLTFLFGPALPPCCVACPSSNCSLNVKFKRKPGTSEAYFTWQSTQQQPLNFSNRIGDLQFEMGIPARLEGWATVGPDLVHLYFSETLPTLKITDFNFNGAKTVMFNDKIKCIGSSSHWATMRPAGETSSIPHLPLVIDSK
jgi:hypothetical protein